MFSSFFRPCSAGDVFESFLAHFGSLLARFWFPFGFILVVLAILFDWFLMIFGDCIFLDFLVAFASAPHPFRELFETFFSHWFCLVALWHILAPFGSILIAWDPLGSIFVTLGILSNPFWFCPFGTRSRKAPACNRYIPSLFFVLYALCVPKWYVYIYIYMYICYKQ